jgi:hypothetical protein
LQFQLAGEKAGCFANQQKKDKQIILKEDEKF